MEERCRAITDAYLKMCPLSETQRGVWTYSRQHLQEPVYHIVLRLPCSPETDTGRLADAVSYVMNLHPVLKVTIGTDETGEPVMLRHDDASPRVRIVRIHEAERASTEKAFMRPLDVENGELYRLLIVQTEQQPYLYASFHHVIFDGLSSNIFMGEVSAVYEGTSIEAETMDAFDVVAWERQRRQSSEYETARLWHESTFQPQDTRILPLADVHGVHQQKAAFKTFPLSVTSAQIEELARKSRQTPNIVTLTAFALLQGCFTDEGQARFTTLFHGRHGRKMMNTVGMLVQTLPVALQWQAETPLDKLMSMVRGQLKRSMVSDVHSFAEVVQTCGGFGDISFVYQGNTIRLPSFCGSQIVRPMLMPSLTGTKLGMELWDEGDGLEMRVEYDADSYSTEMVASMVSTYETILSSMASAVTVGDICYVNESNLACLDTFNQDSSPFKTSATVVDLFREMSCRYPDTLAVVAEDQNLTYRQLEKQTDEWAARLQEKGIGAGSVVGIQVPRNSWMVAAPLAVMKTGAAYLPLLSEQPKTVTDELLSEAAADGLFTTDGFLPLKSCSCPRPSALLALFYTSGSTGKPKAVNVTHQNLLAYCDWYQRYFHPRKGMVIGAYNHFAFDGSLTDIFPALLSGATVCIFPERIRKDIRLLEDFVNRHQVEILDLPTQVGRLFAAQTDCPSLRHIVLGGEAVTPVKPKGNYQLHNQYGPTETTVAATVYPMTGDETVVPIGKPLSHVKCYVVGTYGKRQPIGALGQLWIAGPQVTLGYGIDNPFEQGDFQRLYQTGDFVRYLPDGNLEFIGRRDGMVKIRGFRVELQEVENAVSQLKGVSQAVAVACKHPAEGQSLVVYVTALIPLDTRLLLHELREQLPSYKIPSAIIQVDSLPLTPQGKVNRNALPLPAWSEQAEYVAPQDEQEALICKIFAEVLGLHQVGIEDDFFQLGGTSITAMHVVTRLEIAGYRIGYSALFSNPTPQLLALKLNETGRENPIVYSPKLSMEERVSVEDDGNIPQRPLGDVLLTGATGFLGAHVLKELLLREGGRIYCVVRASERLTGKERLQEVMRFYFGSDVDTYLQRIHVVEGDLLTASFPLTKTPLTVINCAALVKHFSAAEDFRKNNVDGPMRLADYCMERGHRLVQISTLPTGVMNAYVRSKLEAEKRLMALTEKGLSLKIVRLGNLSPRFSDGVFQQHYEKNVTMAWLRTIVLMECFPQDAQDVRLDFTPVDEAAKALLMLAETPGHSEVFHLFRSKMLTMGELAVMLRSSGIQVEPVPQEVFEERISRLMLQPEMATRLTAAMAWYKELSNSDFTFWSHPDNRQTEALLSRCHYRWPVLTASYFQRFIHKM